MISDWVRGMLYLESYFSAADIGKALSSSCQIPARVKGAKVGEGRGSVHDGRMVQVRGVAGGDVVARP